MLRDLRAVTAVLATSSSPASRSPVPGRGPALLARQTGRPSGSAPDAQTPPEPEPVAAPGTSATFRPVVLARSGRSF